VAVHHRDGTDRDAATAVAEACGGTTVEADLAVEADADRLVPDAVAALGRLDVCVAAAGRYPGEATPVAD
jgi:3-oxoacyl-[acyl-carrier protein] reductase